MYLPPALAWNTIPEIAGNGPASRSQTHVCRDSGVKAKFFESCVPLTVYEEVLWAKKGQTVGQDYPMTACQGGQRVV